MKKIFTVLLAAAMLVSISACGKKNKDNNLSAEEIKSRANVAENAKNGMDVEAPTETIDPETAKRVETVQKILEGMPIGEMNELIDTAENEYKSFELLPIESSDFVIGKKLKLVATIEEHQMSFVSQMNMKAEVSNELLSITYPDSESEGGEKKAANYVYGVTEPITTDGGSQYIAVAFGDHELTEENSKYNIDCFALIKMRDDIDMQGSNAESYVLLIEKGFPDKYEIFEAE